MTDSETPVIAQETASAGPSPPWLTRLARRPFAVLTLLGLFLWLPGILSLPALDRDESRFAQSSRQMVDSGDLVDIRFGQVPRYKKPVGIYWLQAASTRIAELFPNVHDDRIWTYRLPSLFGAIAASWLTVWCALAVAGAEAGLLAGLLMLGTVLLTAEATIATTDAVLLACVLGVQGVLLRLYRATRDGDFAGPRNRTVMWGFAALGFGILVKGPVVLAVAAATLIGLVAWDWWDARRNRKPDAPADEPTPEPAWAWLVVLKSWRGLLLVLLLIAPWLIAITIQSRGAFFEQSLGNDFAAKMAGGQESHGGWPGYYLLLSAVAFWPTILFVLPGIVYAVSRRAEPAIRFLLVWAASWWLVVELVPTKLPHYVIDAYPALAILAALFVLDPRPVKFLAPARWIAIAQFVIGAGLFRCDHPGAKLFWRRCGLAGADSGGRWSGAGHCRFGAGDPAQAAAGRSAGPCVLVGFRARADSLCRPAPGPDLDHRAAEADGGSRKPARRCAAGHRGLSGTQPGLCLGQRRGSGRRQGRCRSQCARRQLGAGGRRSPGRFPGPAGGAASRCQACGRSHRAELFAGAQDARHLVPGRAAQGIELREPNQR
jgi:4-amino-4-deoxy-L-arabinose transferase-like glycosyltransferase